MRRIVGASFMQLIYYDSIAGVWLCVLVSAWAERKDRAIAYDSFIYDAWMIQLLFKSIFLQLQIIIS